jgi:hypothetical protein
MLRGVLAAPAVLTVSTGSAFAVASNARCLAKPMSPNEPAAIVGQEALAVDRAVRVRLYSKSQSSVSSARWLVRGSDFSGFKGGSFLKSGEWQEVDASGALKNASFTSTSPPGGFALSDPPRHVLVRFDTSGRIVSVGPVGANNGLAIGASCWSSFAPP